MRIAVVGAGVGGLAAGVRLAAAGHRVTVHEQAAAPGGKCGLVEAGGFRWDSGPSLVTMPWVLRDLLGDAVELLRVEPVTRYRFPAAAKSSCRPTCRGRSRRSRRGRPARGRTGCASSACARGCGRRPCRS